MNRTKIEWVRNPDGSQGYSSNPIKGICPGGCYYCYAKDFYQRFKWNPSVRLDEEELGAPLKLRRPSTIFLCSTHELLGGWVPDAWIHEIANVLRDAPRHRFIILTKRPQNFWRLAQHFNWILPPNIWLGTTITGTERRQQQWEMAYDALRTGSKLKFLSLEPLLALPTLSIFGEPHFHLDWLIIGARTNPYKPPEREWVERIVDKADGLGIPVFLKNNLKPLMGEKLRQEFPK